MNKLTYCIFGVLLAVLGWIWSVTYYKLCEVEKSLVELKIEVARVQAQMIDRHEVESIVRQLTGSK